MRSASSRNWRYCSSDDQVVVEPVVERDAVQAQVRAAGPFVRLAVDVAALDVVERGGAERPRRLGDVAAAADDEDVAGVVGPGGRRDVAVLEQPLADRQQRRCVLADMSMMSTSPCRVIWRICSRYSASVRMRHFAGVHLGRLARRADAERHVGVLGVGEDELLRARTDRREWRRVFGRAIFA